MCAQGFTIEPDLRVKKDSVVYNPDDTYFREVLKPYYILTADNQYLFASRQKGRNPDSVHYMIPRGYRLGKSQRSFDRIIGRKLYLVLFEYLKTVPLLVQDGIQGEIGYKVGLRVTTSLNNPHSGYIGWMGKLMIFPSERDMDIHCWNYIIPEPLPLPVVREILDFWPDFDPSSPLTLFDLTQMDRDIRRVISLGVDYFGGAFKKPNLTMVWNKAESDGLISYHAGCTGDRVLKGLSGTGKTTLTVGPKLEQDDAVVGLPLYDRNGKVGAVELIGLEAGSFAKSEGLTGKSPEWEGLMKSRTADADGDHPTVLAMNIDCENIKYIEKEINGFSVPVPVISSQAETSPGSLICTEYTRSGTTNGRFIFPFQRVNPKWGHNRLKILRSEGLAFKRFDMVEPIIRIVEPVMAVALDSACESIITSAVTGKKKGMRVRSYTATDFMVREESEQALLKLKVYTDLGLGVDGKLVFFITNSGYMGEHDFMGNPIHDDHDNHNGDNAGRKRGNDHYISDEKENKIPPGNHGEKIRVDDSYRLVGLIEDRKIENWVVNPIFGYFVPDPKELEEKHGFPDFSKRFNPLRYYSPEQIQAFAERDIQERTVFLTEMFKGQKHEYALREVLRVWDDMIVPSVEDIRIYYESLYGNPKE